MSDKIHTAEVLAYLYGLQKFGIKLGLANIEYILDAIGNPQRSFPAIHVAGTNGKGSTSSMIASVLSASGYSVGLYTSPHLVRFHERMRINGVAIPDEDVVRLIHGIRPIVDQRNATFFEATTAMAFQYFAERNVDIAVIETGMGGRFDATNVLKPILAAITNISLDHSEYLGATLEEIAFEKAGIIKAQTPCFVSVSDELLHVFERIAHEQQTAIHNARPQRVLRYSCDSFSHAAFSFEQFGKEFSIATDLVGRLQIGNAALALATILFLQTNGWEKISLTSMQEGFLHVRKYSGLRARLERFSHSPEIIVDVAHNPDGFRKMLADYASIKRTEKTHLALGLARTKDYHAVVHEIEAFDWKSISIVQAQAQEAQSPEMIIEAFVVGKRTVKIFSSVESGMDHLLSCVLDSETILLCGSHYVVGEFLANVKYSTMALDNQQ